MKQIQVIALMSVLSAAASAAGTPTSAAPALTVGDPAPALHAMTWVKGEPVTEFKKGKVYVIGFWATWCTPCIDKMAHLSEVAKKHPGQATFIGVHSEAGMIRKMVKPKYVRYIRTFVEKRGGKMAYATAVDDPESPAIYRAWVAAAGFDGTPSQTFIVDRQGKIASIGSPDFDAAFAQVLDGSIDLAAGRAAHQAEAGKFAAVMSGQGSPLHAALMPPMKAIERGDYATALAEANKAIAVNNKDDLIVAGVSRLKLQALLALDEEQGLAYVRELFADKRIVDTLDQGHFGAGGLPVTVGIAISSENRFSSKAYEVAVDCLRQAEKKAPQPQELLDIWKWLAKSYENLGDIGKAIEVEEQFIALARKQHALDPNDYLLKVMLDIHTDELARLKDELRGKS